MDKRDFEIYENEIRYKYRFHRLWKTLSIVFGVWATIFTVLYFVG